MLAYDPDDEDWSPSGWLGAYAAVLYSEYNDCWELSEVDADSGLTDQQRSQFRHYKAIADALTESLHSLDASGALVQTIRRWLTELGVTKEVDEETAATITRAIHMHQIVRDAIKLDLASQATDVLLAGAEQRAIFLIALIADRPLANRASAFLDRATRLYLWGFAPEAVVMCASVLEAAYEIRFPPEEMFRYQITKSGKEYEPYEYERAALASSVFSAEDRNQSRQVRQARNDTLHNAPNTALSAEIALTITAHLLERLLAEK